MIVVSIDLHSAISGRRTTLARVAIANDGTGSANLGHYEVVSIRKGSKASASAALLSGAGVCRRGRVEGHGRRREPILTLLRKALEKMGY